MSYNDEHLIFNADDDDAMYDEDAADEGDKEEESWEDEPGAGDDEEM